MKHPTTWHWLAAVCLVAGGLFSVAAASDDPQFRPMFDGKTLEGWDGDPKFWSVEDGCITGQTTKENPATSTRFSSGGAASRATSN